MLFDFSLNAILYWESFNFTLGQCVYFCKMLQFFCLFIYGCIGSSLRCAGFSLRWLLMCGALALGAQASLVVVRGLSSCGSQAQ